MGYWEEDGRKGDYTKIFNRYHQWLRLYWINRLVEPGAKVLDVGCGEGTLAIMLAKKGCDVTGIEIARSKIERARERAGKEGLIIKFGLGDVEKLDFPDSSFDYVVCTEVLEYLKSAYRALSELKRVSRRFVIVSAPVRHSLFYRFFSGFVGGEDVYTREYSYKQLMRESEAAGLKPIDIIGSRFMALPSFMTKGPLRGLMFFLDRKLDRTRLFRTRGHHTILKLEK